jgi:hypothetical protein
MPVSACTRLLLTLLSCLSLVAWGTAYAVAQEAPSGADTDTDTGTDTDSDTGTDSDSDTDSDTDSDSDTDTDSDTDSGSEWDEAALLECEIQYETLEGFYVDVGSERGLSKTLTGWLIQDHERRTQVQVAEVTNGSSFLRLLSPRPLGFPRAGGQVSLLVEGLQPPVAEADTAGQTDDEFVPLLAPALEEVGVSDPRTVFHGKLTLRQLLQETSDGHLNARRTNLRTSGSLDRIDGTAWSLEWSGDFSYRVGSGYDKVRDVEEIRPEIYRLALSRRFDDRSIFRLGRFIPLALPSVGTVDGIQLEKVLSENWRAGGILGLKPFRDDLDFNTEEPTATPYLTYYVEDQDQRYSGTAGLLGSYYEGDADRLALLVDQNLQWGSLQVINSNEVDFDVGGGETQKGMRLTRMDLALADRRPGWTPRLGVQYWERLDTEAERDLFDPIVLPEAAYFQDNYWRYWVGASHQLGAGFRLDEEVSYTDADSNEALRWQVSLTRSGLGEWKSSSATLSVYNLAGVEQQGYGGRLSGYFPVTGSPLTIQPSVSARFVDYDSGVDDYRYGDLTLRGYWRVSQSWSAAGAATYAITDDVQSILVDLALTFHW